MTILILYRSKNGYNSNQKDKLLELLEQRKMRYKIMSDWTLDQPGINISTIQSAKGLESEVVIISDIDNFMLDFGTNKGSRKLVYVAMTRATKYLVISSGEDVTWTQEIEEILHYKRKEVIKGNCISCGAKINYDKALHVVRCYNCYVENKEGPVNGLYCHLCGKNLSTSLLKLLCLNCFKSKVN